MEMGASLRTLGCFLVLATAAGACEGRAAPSTGVDTVYNRETGKLEQLLADRDRDGKVDTRAFMEGAILKYVEVDRNGDGLPDRWEHYSGGESTADPNQIDQAEEANGLDSHITRREFYTNGVIHRVIDDIDADGRPDKWESYEAGTLSIVELDLVGQGLPSQRLLYDKAGTVTRVETDPDGDGVFVQATGGRG
jgi:hypothetical protein